MRKLLIVAAALWAGTAFADNTTVYKVHFVAPEELAVKHPQSNPTAEYTLSATVQGEGVDKKPWTVTLPLRTYAIQAPRDAATGQASGKRQWKPIVFTSSTDKSSPLIQHIKVNEVITSITLTFTPASPNVPVHTLTIKNIANARHQTSNELTEFALTFQKISWTYKEGSKTMTDDWQTTL